MRIVAIITTYNESRYVSTCLEHYRQQGVEVYLLDNESTDETVDLARQFKNDNLIAIENVPRKGFKSWKEMLQRKETLADELAADWLMHADIDEIRVPETGYKTLLDAVTNIDAQGFNAINFIEYTFIPTKESPDHDHSEFMHSMKWYYPFLPKYPNRLNLWKKQSKGWRGVRSAWHELIQHRRILGPSVDLHSSGGHQVRFPDLKMYPNDFKMKHYIFLSRQHLERKYVKIKYDPNAPAGYHGWRAKAKSKIFELPTESQLRYYQGDHLLDPSNPEKKHIFVLD